MSEKGQRQADGVSNAPESLTEVSFLESGVQ